MAISKVTTGSITDSVAIDTDTLVVDGTNGRVSIGTSSAESLPLTVAGSQSAIALVDTDRVDNTYYSAVWGDQVANLHLVADYQGTYGSSFISMRVGGTALANEKVRVDSSGRVTMPYQPCFHGYTSSSGGWGSNYLINPNQVVTNVGNHFSNGVFTCPVDGVYHVEGGTLVRNNSFIYIRHNGVNQAANHINSGSTSWWINLTGHSYINCSANDTLEVYATGSVFNGNSHAWASFRLVG